ncbi:MAG: rod shape-determining protein RodA [Candidatus Magasanikbacteria bacterium]
MLRFSFASGTWRKFDWVLFLTALVLSLVGLAAIYSVDLSRGEELNFSSSQIIALCLGIAICFVAFQFHISFYESTARFAYLASLILLISVLLFGVTVRGTTGWFRLFGFSFQPAEFAKVALVLFLAWRIERQGRRFEKWQFVVATFVMTLILVGLILLQPDLGSSSILLFTWFGLLLVVGTKRRYIIGIVVAALAVAAIGWVFLFKDYQKERVLTFINPERDPLGSGYNVTQSIIAIGAGQLRGRGLGFGSQSQLHFLPEAQTDFIFSVIGEELGFVGSAIVLTLFSILVWRIVRIAEHSRSDFCSYVVVGIAFVFFFQIVVNMGAALGLLPVTGVTLPFLSYGGSSLIMNFLLIGIAQSAARSS